MHRGHPRHAAARPRLAASDPATPLVGGDHLSQRGDACADVVIDRLPKHSLMRRAPQSGSTDQAAPSLNWMSRCAAGAR